MNASFTVSHDRDWTWVKFSDKPGDTILEALRKFARFSHRRFAWYVTEHMEESELRALLGLQDNGESGSAMPEPPAESALAPETPTEPESETTEADRARAWLAGVDLESIPLDKSVTAEFWKCSVGVFHGEKGYSLYTRNPQQKQHRFTATRRVTNCQNSGELLEGLERFIQEQEEKETRRITQRDAKRQARAAFVNPYKVGDILYGSWGYDQTNIDYFQVIAVRPVALQIRKIAANTTRSTMDGGECTPARGEFTREPVWVTIQVSERGYHSVPSPIHGGLSIWDGRPKYWSDGH